jgi:DNA-binding phage protein
MEEIVRALEGTTALEEIAGRFLNLSQGEKKTLLQALMAVRTERAGGFLNLVYPEEGDKEIRKLIKTLLFRLRTAGVKVEEPREPGEPAYKRIEEKREHKGFLSNYDAEGTRIILFAFEMKANTLAFFHGITHFSQGLMELTSGPLKKKDLESIVSEYRGGAQELLFVADISAKYAAYLLQEASALSGKHREEAEQIVQFTSRFRQEVEQPGDIYRLAVPEGERTPGIAEIAAKELLSPFLLRWETFDEDRKAFAGIGTSGIMLPPHMMEEQREAFLEGLLDKEPLKSKIHPFKRLMEDYGYIFHVFGDFASYKGMMELCQQAGGSRQLFSRFLRKWLEVKEEETPGLQGLIVNPYEQIRR